MLVLSSPLLFCLSWISIDVTNIMTKSSLGEEKAYSSLHLFGHTPSRREVRAGNRGRNSEVELKQRLCKNTVDQLAHHDLVSLLSSTPGPSDQEW